MTEEQCYHAINTYEKTLGFFPKGPSVPTETGHDNQQNLFHENMSIICTRIHTSMRDPCYCNNTGSTNVNKPSASQFLLALLQIRATPAEHCLKVFHAAMRINYVETF